MISELVKEQLSKKNISQSELARRIGTTKQNLYKKLKRDTLSAEDINAIEKALDIKLMQYFVDAKDAKSKPTKKDADCSKASLSLYKKDFSQVEKNAKIIADNCPMECYSIALFLQKEGEYDASVTVAKAGLSASKDEISDMFLNLIMALSYANLKNIDEAKSCFKSAKNIGIKLSVTSPVKEYNDLLFKAIGRK